MNRYVSQVAVALSMALIGLASMQASGSETQQYPDVVGVEVQPRGENRFDFAVTISSPYDTAQRYADGFRVMGADGRTYGERKLLHDHANEQPFTRELTGVAIPPDVDTIIVQGRDQKSGYGGKTVEVTLPER